jgi:hypothetical protein
MTFDCPTHHAKNLCIELWGAALAFVSCMPCYGAAQIYKCAGADGVAVFSDSPCGDDAQALHVEPANPGPATSIAPSGKSEALLQVGNLAYLHVMAEQCPLRKERADVLFFADLALKELLDRQHVHLAPDETRTFLAKSQERARHDLATTRKQACDFADRKLQEVEATFASLQAQGHPPTPLETQAPSKEIHAPGWRVPAYEPPLLAEGGRLFWTDANHLLAFGAIPATPQQLGGRGLVLIDVAARSERMLEARAGGLAHYDFRTRHGSLFNGRAKSFVLDPDNELRDLDEEDKGARPGNVWDRVQQPLPPNQRHGCNEEQIVVADGVITTEKPNACLSGQREKVVPAIWYSPQHPPVILNLNFNEFRSTLTAYCSVFLGKCLLNNHPRLSTLSDYLSGQPWNVPLPATTQRGLAADPFKFFDPTNGAVDEVLFPEWIAANGIRDDNVLFTKAGIVVVQRDSADKIAPSAAHLFTVQGGRLYEILPGQDPGGGGPVFDKRPMTFGTGRNDMEVSPDGCKLAFQTSTAGASNAGVRSNLQIIDLCAAAPVGSAAPR